MGLGSNYVISSRDSVFFAHFWISTSWYTDDLNKNLWMNEYADKVGETNTNRENK